MRAVGWPPTPPRTARTTHSTPPPLINPPPLCPATSSPLSLSPACRATVKYLVNPPPFGGRVHAVPGFCDASGGGDRTAGAGRAGGDRPLARVRDCPDRQPALAPPLPLDAVVRGLGIERLGQSQRHALSRAQDRPARAEGRAGVSDRPDQRDLPRRRPAGRQTGRPRPPQAPRQPNGSA